MNRLAPLLALLLFACANTSSIPHRIALLHVGMTQQEVTDLLGKPRTINNMGALFVYDYLFTESGPAALHPSEPPTMAYYVIIGRDGRVLSFGPN
jgi:outer membrane protein assembly factor BamE (lipoprotein component of BamABCDE complex)